MRVSENEKYAVVDGETRVFYQAGKDQLQVQFMDEDLSHAKTMQVERGTQLEADLRIRMTQLGVIKGSQGVLNVASENSENIRLGDLPNGKQEVWNPLYHPNMMLIGAHGSGRNTVENNILLHARKHPNQWEAVIVPTEERMGLEKTGHEFEADPLVMRDDSNITDVWIDGTLARISHMIDARKKFRTQYKLKRITTELPGVIVILPSLVLRPESGEDAVAWWRLTHMMKESAREHVHFVISGSHTMDFRYDFDDLKAHMDIVVAMRSSNRLMRDHLVQWGFDADKAEKTEHLKTGEFYTSLSSHQTHSKVKSYRVSSKDLRKVEYSPILPHVKMMKESSPELFLGAYNVLNMKPAGEDESVLDVVENIVDDLNATRS